MENKTSHFITPLVRSINLEPSNGWEAALVEILYPYSWYTINKDSNDFAFSITKAGGVDTGVWGLSPNTVDEGYYSSPVSLLENIWSKKPEAVKATYQYTPLDRKVAITLEKNHALRFNWTLARILGFKKNNLGPVIHKTRNTFQSHFPVELSPFYHIFVYSDLVQPSLVGDTEESVLAVLPIDQTKPWGSFCFREILSPQYYTINKAHMSQIEIKLMNEHGEAVRFEFGKTLLKIHVRRRQPKLSF